MADCLAWLGLSWTIERVSSDSRDSRKNQDMHARMEKSMAAIASFARIAEDFKIIRKAAATTEARDRIDRLIKLNQETMDAVKRGLLVNEHDFGRAALGPSSGDE